MSEATSSTNGSSSPSRQTASKSSKVQWSLILKIGAKDYYRVVRLTPDPAVAKAAIRLQKTDGKFYDLHRDKWGVACSCPSFLWRRKPTGCKHCIAVQESGLL